MRALQERRCRRASARSFQRTPKPKHSRGLLVGRRTENNIVASTVTDCEGNFVLPVAPGHYRLSGGYPDRPQPQPATVNVTNQARIYDITLDATTTPTERL